MNEKRKINWTAVIATIFTIICTIVVIYANIFCIKNKIDWYYVALIDGISFTILGVFYYVIIEDIIWKIKHKQK